MKQDKYGEVINDEATFKAAALILKMSGSLLLGWTDQRSSHFDILFTYNNASVPTFGPIQGGIRGTDLFVSIMRVGSFGFEVKNKDTDWGYYDEKLCANRLGEVTGEALAELINGVKKNL